MLTRDELLKYPNYLLTSYQLQIFSLLSTYMKANSIKKQKDVAKKLGVSDAYVSQIMNGECNFSLKKLIELGLKVGKIPYLEFVSVDEYFHREALLSKGPILMQNQKPFQFVLLLGQKDPTIVSREYWRSIEKAHTNSPQLETLQSELTYSTSVKLT